MARYYQYLITGMKKKGKRGWPMARIINLTEQFLISSILIFFINLSCILFTVSIYQAISSILPQGMVAASAA
jgi:hypothetical protein